jgi:Ca2+-binding EF-hand superfamily protein
MDLDGNGAVSAAEHAQFRAERQRAMAAQGRPMRNAASAPTFESIDANNDGQISRGEMAAMRQARMAARGGGYGPGPGVGPRGPVGFGPGNPRPCWRSGP